MIHHIETGFVAFSAVLGVVLIVLGIRLGLRTSWSVPLKRAGRWLFEIVVSLAAAIIIVFFGTVLFGALGFIINSIGNLFR